MKIKNLTIDETRKMSDKKIQNELGLCRIILEDRGFTKEEACDILSSTMNLAIALNEKRKTKESI